MLEKPLVICQDHSASPFLDPAGWTVQRKRMWCALFSGLHYNQTDFSFTPSDPSGRTGRKGYRKFYGTCRELLKGSDFAQCNFIHHKVTEAPPDTTIFFVQAGYRNYFGYLVDQREVTDSGYGGTIEGRFVLTINPGNYAITFYSPETGHALSKPHPLHGGVVNLKIPAFQHDLFFKITRS
jgi:hypothetical protein